MSDARINALSRRLDRVEQFLERQGFERRFDYDAFLADEEAAAARARPPATPPPMPHAARDAGPPIAEAVPPDDPRWEPGPRPSLSVAAPVEPHVPDERGFLVPVGSPGDVSTPREHLPPPMPAHLEEQESPALARPPLAEVQTRGFERDVRVDRDTGNLEQLVGLKLAGWVGAIVLVIGAALGVKFAYDQGWLGGLPNSVRLGLLYALGFAVIGAGEWVYRRVGDVASAGVFGAGVAILFVVGYAGDAYFNLYEQRVAFALMAGASAIGALVAWRAHLASIAVLSILGANLAPVLLGRSAAGESTLLVYLLALQVLALLLAHVGAGDRWWALRGVSLATTAVWVAVRLATPATMRSQPTVLFTIAYALIFQVEAALAARRAAWTWAQRHASFATFSTTVTALLTLAVLVWTDVWPAGQVGATLLGMAMLLIVAGAAGIGLGTKAPHAGAERSAAPYPSDAASDPGRREYALPRRAGDADDEGRAFRELAVSWLGQGMSLVAVAAAAAFSGPTLLAAWVAIAVVYAAVGVYVRRPATVVAGAVVWALAVAHLAFASFADLNARPLFVIAGAPITQALVAGVVLWAAGQALAAALGARRLDVPTGWFSRLAKPLAGAMPTLATLVAAAVLYASLPPLAATVGLALLAWATLAASRVGKRSDVAALAVCVAAFALGKWFAVDLLSTRLDGRPLGERAIFNGTFAVGAIVAASGVALTWASAGRRRSADRQADPRAEQVERLLALGVAVGALAIALCVEFGPAARAFNAERPVQTFASTQLMLLAQTALLTLLALVAAPLARAIAPLAVDSDRARQACGWFVVALAAKFVAIDSLAWIADELFRAPTPFVNAQAAVAALVVVACAIAARRNAATQVGQAAAALAAVVGLAAGSIELARAVGPERTLVALSIFWAAYAAAAVAVGFALRGGMALRVGGLILLAVTIAKVVLVDLASAGTGLRILSFLAVGALLLATSVFYGKFGQRLLRRDDEAPGFEVRR